MAPAVDDRALLEILEYGLDDWISLSDVGSALSRILGLPDEQLCAELCRCVHALVEAGWFRPGTLAEPEGHFAELSQSLDDALADLCDDWSWDDRSWWWALWFEVTERGRAEALQAFPELSDDANSYLDRRVLFDLFAAGSRHRLSLGTVADALRDRLEVVDEEICFDVRRFVIGLVAEGWFRPGTVEGTQLVPLTGPVDELLAALCERWDGAEQDQWGSALWLELTDEGRAEALRRFPALDAR